MPLYENKTAWYAAMLVSTLALMGAGCTTSEEVAINTEENVQEESTQQETTQNTIDEEISSEEDAKITEIIIADAKQSVVTGQQSTVNSQPSTINLEPSTLYTNGTYSATGSYTSPAGTESVPLTVTIENDTIVAASVETPATNSSSQKFQIMFAENFAQLVVGKSVDSVRLDKVSGSSLTPKGFNDALEKIKSEAKS